jgi:hypothetical protein
MGWDNVQQSSSSILKIDVLNENYEAHEILILNEGIAGLGFGYGFKDNLVYLWGEDHIKMDI